jgi:hypothetical protein
MQNNRALLNPLVLLAATMRQLRKLCLLHVPDSRQYIENARGCPQCYSMNLALVSDRRHPASFAIACVDCGKIAGSASSIAKTVANWDCIPPGEFFMTELEIFLREIVCGATSRLAINATTSAARRFLAGYQAAVEADRPRRSRLWPRATPPLSSVRNLPPEDWWPIEKVGQRALFDPGLARGDSRATDHDGRASTGPDSTGPHAAGMFELTLSENKNFGLAMPG